MLRLLRFAGFFISLVLPGFYVALLTFHPRKPDAHSSYPQHRRPKGRRAFSVVVETFVVEATFELLREAGARMPPRLVIPAISIIGALVLGDDAAIRAGLVSPCKGREWWPLRASLILSAPFTVSPLAPGSCGLP